MKNLAISLMLGLALVGCSKDEGGGAGGPGTGGGEPTTQAKTLSGLEYKVLSGEVKGDDAKVAGSGSMIFRNPAPGLDANFTVAFTLEDKGSLAVVGNSDVQLNGVNVIFSRNGKELGVELKVGSESYDLSPVFEKIKADGNLEFSFDIHAHGHLIFIRNDLDEKEFDFEAEVNSKFWGLKLDKASVSSAKVNKPAQPH